MSENKTVTDPNIEVSFSGATFADAEFVTKQIDADVAKDLDSKSEVTEIDQKAVPTSEKVEPKTAEEKAVEKEIKRLKAKFGEDEFEIAAEALIPHKVDGKEELIQLQELLNNYSGKVAWDKRFTELDKERKAHKKETEDINKYVQGFAELVNKKDIMGALAYVAQFTGKDPIAFRKEARDSLLTQLEKYITMSPEERRFAELEEENQILQQHRQSEIQRSQMEKSSEALLSEMRQIQETHGLTDDRLIEIVDVLEKQGVDINVLSPGDLLRYHQTDLAYSRVEKALDSLSPGLSDDDEVVEIFSKKVLANPKLSEQELIEQMRKTLRIANHKKPEDQLAEKISKTVSSKAPATQLSKESVAIQQALTFRDLDF